MATSVPWAPSWTRLRPQSGAGVSWRQPCMEGSLACRPARGAPLAGRRRRAATGLLPGDREPRPGRGARKGLRLGSRWSPPTTVCAEEPATALATQWVGPGAGLSVPGPLDPKHLPSPSAFQHRHCGHLSVPPPACPPCLRGNVDAIRPVRPSPDPFPPTRYIF